jgi:hypothetical protein
MTQRENGDAGYKGYTLEASSPLSSRSAASAVAADYEAILFSVMDWLAGRYEASPEYPFIDTKLDLLSGEAFPEDDPVRGKGAVYGWIQGRGLEAIAGHCRWMRQHCLYADLRRRLERILHEVLTELRMLRQRNMGRLHFAMSPRGEPFAIDSKGRCRPLNVYKKQDLGTTDLFCAKGMFAAASYLEDTSALEEARGYLDAVDRAIEAGTLENDQIQLDPKNPVTPISGRIPHGSKMIHIGTAALLADRGCTDGIAMGLRLIRYELQHHVNLENRVPTFEPFDMWEAIDSAGEPYRKDGSVMSDPGHALEFAGLSLLFFKKVEQHADAPELAAREIEDMKGLMPKILLQNFANGYQAGPGGICKAFDLISRQPINSDMPWWSLPETIRAALLAAEAAVTEVEREACNEVFRACHNAFTRHFVLPGLHLNAVQTRNLEGKPIPVIPATPDADPGYHTGLSLIDAIGVLRKHGG